MNKEILEYMALFVKYGVPDHIFIEANRDDIKEIKKVISDVKDDLKKYSCDIFEIKKKGKLEDYKENLKSTNFKKVFFVIETKFIPTGKEADRLFYFLSRIGKYTGLDDKEIQHKSVSCIIIGKNTRFLLKLSGATNSSLGLRFLELEEEKTESNKAQEG